MKPILTAALLLALAGPAAALTQKEACEAAADITAQAVELRQKGTGKRRAETLLAEGLSEEAQALKPAVYQTVDWVWSLKKSDATPELAEALREQCIAFE